MSIKQKGVFYFKDKDHVEKIERQQWPRFIISLSVPFLTIYITGLIFHSFSDWVQINVALVYIFLFLLSELFYTSYYIFKYGLLVGPIIENYPVSVLPYYKNEKGTIYFYSFGFFVCILWFIVISN